MLALLQWPDQLDRLRADRALLRPAVEEVLRYDSPVQIAVRTAYEEMDLGGQQIEPGSTVLALLGAANRDPARFSDPDRLDVARAEGSPMSFGATFLPVAPQGKHAARRPVGSPAPGGGTPEAAS